MLFFLVLLSITGIDAGVRLRQITPLPAQNSTLTDYFHTVSSRNIACNESGTVYARVTDSIDKNISATTFSCINISRYIEVRDDATRAVWYAPKIERTLLHSYDQTDEHDSSPHNSLVYVIGIMIMMLVLVFCIIYMYVHFRNNVHYSRLNTSDHRDARSFATTSISGLPYVYSINHRDPLPPYSIPTTDISFT